MVTQGQARLAPGVEVSLNVDGAADPMVLTNGPVLVKGRVANDGRLVDARGLVDVVHAAVRLDGAQKLCARRGIVGAEALDNVVFDQRIGGPAVDREIAVSTGLPGTAISDSAEGGVRVNQQ